MSRFDDFITALETNLADYARSSFAAWRDAATSDGEDFVAQTRDDLERWTQELAAGQIDEDEFMWLIGCKKDLAELLALKQKGLSEAKLDEFFHGLTGVITNTAVSIFL